MKIKSRLRCIIIAMKLTLLILVSIEQENKRHKSTCSSCCESARNATEITPNITAVVTTTIEPEQKSTRTGQCPSLHGICACELYISSGTNHFGGNIGGKYSAIKNRFCYFSQSLLILLLKRLFKDLDDKYDASYEGKYGPDWVSFPLYKRVSVPTYYVYFIYDADEWYIDINEWHHQRETRITNNQTTQCPPAMGWGMKQKYTNGFYEWYPEDSVLIEQTP